MKDHEGEGYIHRDGYVEKESSTVSTKCCLGLLALMALAGIIVGVIVALNETSLNTVGTSEKNEDL